MSKTDPDTLCGIGSYKPAWLQVFARIGAFVGIYSVSGFFTSTLTIYVNSQVPMLERQFGFSSAETGLLMSCNDIGYLTCVIFAGYIARKVHIPKGLSISTILFGICGLLCALPYFLLDKSMFAIDAPAAMNVSQRHSMKPVPMCDVGNSSDINVNDNCDVSNSTEPSDSLKKLWLKKVALTLMAVGFVFQGIGKSPRYPFVTLYIDDTVNKRKTGFYMGILSATGIFGPVIAYILGSVFSRIYVTLEAVDISPGDPRWIGAWWLGFLIFGACSIIFGFPLMCFPRKLRSKRKLACEDIITKAESMKKPSQNAAVKEIKHLMFSIRRVLSNPVFIVITLSSCFNIVGIAGSLAFSPKYIASQYTVPLWKANILLALSGVTAASLGSFIGGVLSRKIKMTPKKTMIILIIFFSVHMFVTAVGLLLGCDQPELIGNNGQTGGSPLYDTVEDPPRGDCTCNDEKYFPICGADRQSYYSPCHAGCTVQDKMDLRLEKLVRGKPSDTIIGILIGGHKIIRKIIPISDSLGEEAALIDISSGIRNLKCRRTMVSAAPIWGIRSSNFSNCTTIPSGRAVSGLCDQGCTTKLYVYAAFNFLGGLSSTAKIVPVLIAKLRLKKFFHVSMKEKSADKVVQRCVEEKDRAVATAISGFLYSALGWMPGPVIFGRIIDSTCLLWKYTCGERLSCQLYDIGYFRIAVHVYGIICKGMGLLLIIGLYVYFRIINKKEWREEPSQAREALVNGKELTITTSDS